MNDNNPSIQRIEEKCIKCGVCLKTCESMTGIDRSADVNGSLCVNCGACVQTCPMGAITPKYSYHEVLNLVKDTSEIVAISIAPAVRVSLCEDLGRELGENMEDLIPSILKSIGFRYVFDVTFGADATIMEEATELLERLNGKGRLPMMTSCCPAWVKYTSMFMKEKIPNLSTTKSPIGIQSTLIKTYFKEMNNIDKKIISVVVAPCTAKKWEIQEGDTDYVITTRELALLIKECDIDIPGLKPSNFDSLLSRGSNSGVSFGHSGGVASSVLSTLHFLVTHNSPELNAYKIDIEDGIGSKTFKIGKYEIRALVISGLNKLIEMKDNLDEYDFIEVMACSGGCIGGGGQPLVNAGLKDNILNARRESLMNPNDNKNYAHQNMEIVELYRSYLGKPLSTKSEKLLHTIRREL